MASPHSDPWWRNGEWWWYDAVEDDYHSASSWMNHDPRTCPLCLRAGRTREIEPRNGDEFVSESERTVSDERLSEDMFSESDVTLDKDEDRDTENEEIRSAEPERVGRRRRRRERDREEAENESQREREEAETESISEREEAETESNRDAENPESESESDEENRSQGDVQSERHRLRMRRESEFVEGESESEKENEKEESDNESEREKLENVSQVSSESALSHNASEDSVSNYEESVELIKPLFDMELLCAGIAAAWLEQVYVLGKRIEHSQPTEARATDLQGYGWWNRDPNEPRRFAEGIMGGADMEVVGHWNKQGGDPFAFMAAKIRGHPQRGYYISMHAHECEIAHDISLLHDGKIYKAMDSRRGIFVIHKARELADFLETCFAYYCGRWNADVETLHLAKFALSVVKRSYV